jgi:toxin ParE1/3/4
MKTYTVIFTPRAKANLPVFIAHIADRSGEARAESFTGRIVANCQSLATFPERGGKRDDIRPNLWVQCARACRGLRAVAISHAFGLP